MCLVTWRLTSKRVLWTYLIGSLVQVQSEEKNSTKQTKNVDLLRHGRGRHVPKAVYIKNFYTVTRKSRKPAANNDQNQRRTTRKEMALNLL